MTLQLAYSQETYPKKVPCGKDTCIILTNQQGQEINKVFLDRDRLTELLDTEKQKTAGFQSVIDDQKVIIGRLNHLDSLNSISIKNYRSLVELEQDKYQDMKQSYTEYTKQLKKQNRHIWLSSMMTIPVSIAFTALIVTLIK